MIYLVDAKENAIFTIGNLFAVDAVGATTDLLEYSVVQGSSENCFTLSIKLDDSFVKDPSRVFPIVIDPSVMISSSETADTAVSSVYPNANYYLNTQLWTGYNLERGIQRSYLCFYLPSTIPVGSVTYASLDLEHASGFRPTICAYRATQPWSSSTLTWNNKPTTYPTASAVGQVRGGSSWYTIDVTSFVQYWNNGGANYGFEIRSTNESTVNGSGFYSSDEVSPHKPELHINYVAPVGVDQSYSTYTQTIAYREYMTSRMNCYGYAIHVYSLQMDPYNSSYKQQPGEFAANGISFSSDNEMLAEVLYDELANPEDVLNYIESLIYADFATLSGTGSGWTISRTTATATVPSGYRKIALTIGVNHDYHFYVRHSDGTWSHKRGGLPATNLSTDTNVQITDSNISSVVMEAGYDDGVRYYLIGKPLIVDYPHFNGHDASVNTYSSFSDRAGDEISKSASVSGTVQLGRFDYPGDLDWYVFTPTTTGVYDLSVLITNTAATGFDVDMAVFNTYGNALAVDDDVGKPEISISLTAGVRYFIRIKDSGGTTYTYKFTFEPQ